MTPAQRAHIESHRRQIRYWPVLALLLVGLLGSAYGWLWTHAPVNLSADLVLQQFHNRTLSNEELIMLAARGTLALVACGLFVLVIVLLVSVALWNEHRLIRILDELDPPAAPAEKSGDDEGLGQEGGTVDVSADGHPATVASPPEAQSPETPSADGSDRP